MIAVRTYFWCCLFLFIGNSYGQTANTYGAELNYAYGKLLRITTDFPETKHAWYTEGRFLIHTHGKKYWHQFFHFPTIAINVSFTDYGNKRVLGNSIALYPTIDGKKLLTDKLSFEYGFGGGLSWFDRPYSIDNKENVVVGAKVTAIAAGNLGFGLKLSDNLQLKTGFSIRHCSDGHIKVPNVGANLFLWNLGVKYDWQSEQKNTIHEEKTLDRSIKLLYSAGWGTHEVEGTEAPSGGPKYPVYFTMFGMSKRLTYRSNLRGELAYNYYQDYHDEILNHYLFEEKIRLRSSKLVLSAGYEMYFNHLSVMVKAGANLYYPFRKALVERDMILDKFMDQNISGEFGLNYYRYSALSDKKLNPFVGVGIKTIWGKADYIYTALGIKF